MVVQCDACRHRIEGEPELTVRRRGGGRLDFCASPACAPIAWLAVLESARPARLSAIKARAMNVRLPQGLRK
jgi:hypothetical protein